MLKATYLLIGHVFVLLGIIGIFLPVFPTTPFLLIASYFYSKGSKRFETWLLTHKYFGPPILLWRQKKAISKQSKILSVTLLTCSFSILLLFVNVPLYLKFFVGIIIFGAMVFILMRPSF